MNVRRFDIVLHIEVSKLLATVIIEVFHTFHIIVVCVPILAILMLDSLLFLAEQFLRERTWYTLTAFQFIRLKSEVSNSALKTRSRENGAATFCTRLNDMFSLNQDILLRRVFPEHCESLLLGRTNKHSHDVGVVFFRFRWHLNFDRLVQGCLVIRVVNLAVICFHLMNSEVKKV